MGLIRWIKDRLPTREPKNEKERNQRLTENTIRIRVHRNIEGGCVEIGVFDAQLDRDENDNVIITNEEEAFKEELPGLRDSLIVQVLGKLNSITKDRTKQVSKLESEIESQEKIIARAKDGKVKVKMPKKKTFDDEELEDEIKEVKINIITERVKLMALKVSLFTLKFLKGEGTYERIEQDGVRTLFYEVVEGSLKPCFWKRPTLDGEPVIVTADVTQRQKFYKSAMDRLWRDLLESKNNEWKGILAMIGKVLLVLIFAGNLLWTFNLINWQKEIAADADVDTVSQLTDRLNKCYRDQERMLSNQREVDNTLYDWAKMDMEKRMGVLKTTQAKPQNLTLS